MVSYEFIMGNKHEDLALEAKQWEFVGEAQGRRLK